MDTISKVVDESRYDRTAQASKRVRQDIDADLIQRRAFDLSKKYLPDGLSFAPLFTALG